MTVKYLIDTNILSEVKCPKPNSQVMTKLELHRKEIATASIVIHELFFGCLLIPNNDKS